MLELRHGGDFREAADAAVLRPLPFGHLDDDRGGNDGPGPVGRGRLGGGLNLGGIGSLEFSEPERRAR